MSERIEDRQFAHVGRECAALATRMAARAVTRMFDDALRSVDLKVTQFTLLASLRAAKFESTSQMAEILAIERSTLSRNLKLLEERKLIRLSQESGGAPRAPELTAKGYHLIEAALPLWQKAQRTFVRQLKHDWNDTRGRLHDLAHVA